MTRADATFVILDVDFLLENAPVFQTQVAEQMLAMSRAGLRTALVTSVRDRARFDDVVGNRLRASGTTIELIEHRGRLANIVNLGMALRRLEKRVQVGTLYFRGVWGRVALAIAHPLRPNKYVYDLRGALGDETDAAGSASWKRGIFRALESWSVRGATRVHAVSAPLADLVKRQYGRSDVRVIPSCVTLSDMAVAADARERARAAWQLPAGAIVLAYCGGLDRYQLVQETLDLWNGLIDEPDVHFLLVTNDAPHQPSMLSGIEALGSRLRRLSVPRADVPGVLAGADAGFLLREMRVMNAAASPVKFAEYLAAGLAVVATPGIGDASALIEEHRVGVLVDWRQASDAVERVRGWLREFRVDRAGTRARAQQLARRRYDWDAYGGVFQEIYGATEGLSPNVTGRPLV